MLLMIQFRLLLSRCGDFFIFVAMRLASGRLFIVAIDSG